MKINEITRPESIRDARFILSRYGYGQLGHGVYGSVFGKENEPFILKLFSIQDSSYVAYLNLITRVNNPHFPQVKGKPIKVNNEYYAVQLERLEPIEGFNVELQKSLREYVIKYQKLAELENQYYTKIMDMQRSRNITDEDRELLRQLVDLPVGELPPGWEEYGNKIIKYANDRSIMQRIQAIRQQVLAFEQHFPDLAEALRLIDQYVLYGMPADLHSENVMQRGATLVITDPSSGGAEGSRIPPQSPRQPQLFKEPKQNWNDKLANTNYAALSQRFPNMRQYTSHKQRNFEDPKSFRDVY